MPDSLERESKKMKQPNFIIICADLSFGDLACYGAGIPTPHLDRMALRSLCPKLRDCSYLHTVTLQPSHRCLSSSTNKKRPDLTGRRATMIIGENERTLPATLRNAGYDTAVIGKWHISLSNGNVDWNKEIDPAPLDIGFNTSYIMAATSDRVPASM